MKKLLFTIVAIFALVGCGGGGNSSTTLSSGSLDKSFANNGVKTINISTDDGFTDIKSKVDNSILGAYTKKITSNNYDGVIALYKDDGTLDSSFGNNGKFITGIINDDMIKRIAVDSNGNIYAVGSVADNNFDYSVMVLKLDSNGNLDTNFASSGYFKYGLNGHEIWGEAITLHNNKIIVGINDYQNSGNSVISIRRLNIDGSIDTSFGTNGEMHFGYSNKNTIIHNIAVDTSGNIYIAGKTEITSGDSAILVAKVKPNGTLDTSFGTNGLKIIDSNSGDDSAEAVKVDNSGHILIAGVYSNFHMFIARLNSNGTLDTSFGDSGNGMVIRNDGSSVFNFTIDSNNNIILTGVFLSSSAHKYLPVFKYDITGKAVSSFGENGVAKFFDDSNTKYGMAIDIDSSGKIIVGGAYEEGSTLQGVILKVNP